MYQCDGKVDMVVMGAGTGGTAAGIGREAIQSNRHLPVVNYLRGFHI